MITWFSLNLMLMCACFQAISGEQVVKPDMDVAIVRKIMSDAGFEETVIAVEAVDGTLSAAWNVGDGVLIVGYRQEQQTVTDLMFLLSGKNAKSEQIEHWLKVKDFDVATGELTILVPPRRTRD